MFNILKNFFGKLINDILRDKDCEKYSVTKTIAVISFIMLLFILIMGIYIMIKRNEIDHFLVGEIMFFILTLLGFKNFKRADYSLINKKEKVE